MPQRGVTLAEVEAAVQSLRAAARPVTARSVRHALGDRGSLTTLAAHLRAVRKQEAEQEAEDEVRPRLALPDALAEGLMRGAERHWAELNDAAQAIAEQAEAQAQERVAAAREAEHEARATAEGARAAEARTAETLAETERALKALRKEHVTLVEEHRDLGVALRVVEERERGAEALAAERKETIEQRDALLARAQDERNEARDALERYRSEAAVRERTLTERMVEAEKARREAEAASEQIRTRIGDVESALKRERVKRDAAVAQCEEFRKILDAERQEHAHTETELATLRERCDALSASLERSERHGHAITAALERAEERALQAHAALESELRRATRGRPEAPGANDVD